MVVREESSVKRTGRFDDRADASESVGECAAALYGRATMASILLEPGAKNAPTLGR